MFVAVAVGSLRTDTPVLKYNCTPHDDGTPVLVTRKGLKPRVVGQFYNCTLCKRPIKYYCVCTGEITLQSTLTNKMMTTSCDSFFAVRIDFGEYVRTLQYSDRRTAEIVLQQSRAQYGYDNAVLVEVHY